MTHLDQTTEGDGRTDRPTDRSTVVNTALCIASNYGRAVKKQQEAQLSQRPYD